MKKVSIVVPIYNEEESIPHLYQELDNVSKLVDGVCEFLLVNDGSKDKSFEKLSEIAEKDTRVVVLNFRRNFGQTAAMAAGIENSTGDVVITMDGDLQNDPAEIPQMIEKLDQGYDLIAGWRKDRKDKLVSRKIPSKIANWLISKITKVSLHDYGCSLKVMKGDLARKLKLYGEMHRFIPALANEIGAKILEVPVNHRARQFGETKYGISRTIRVILDLLTVKFLLGYSKRPIHLFGTVGLACAGFGFLSLFFMSIQKIFFDIAMGNRPLMMLGILLIILGFQFMVFGLLAEVLTRTYYESQNKKTYEIRDILNNPHESNS